MIITIDGPTASGKSTIANELAKKLHFFYLSSGFLYRAFGYWIIEKKIDHSDIEKIKKLFNNFPFSYQLTDEYIPKININGKDVTSIIMEEKTGTIASNISQIKEVREYIFNLQHDLVKNKNSIIDGRDCGTKVFPKADIKFFLTASIDARAQRLCKRNKNIDFEICKNILIERDQKDTSRSIAPLLPAKDAIIIDNTNYTKEETLKIISNIIKKHLL